MSGHNGQPMCLSGHMGPQHNMAAITSLLCRSHDWSGPAPKHAIQVTAVCDTYLDFGVLKQYSTFTVNPLIKHIK